MKGDVDFAVLIPALDAERWITSVVERSLHQCCRVLVIDDGSRDRTADTARVAGAEVISFQRNRGKGAALRTGFAYWFQRGVDRVLTLDADGQHLPEEIPKLLRVGQQADLVIGSRDHLFSQMGGVRRWSNRVSSRAISFAAGRPLPDVQSGFRLYSRRLLERVGFPEDRFEAESAIVVRASRSGCRVQAVPVELGFADGRRTSHYRPLIDSLRIAGAVVRARVSGPARWCAEVVE